MNRFSFFNSLLVGYVFLLVAGGTIGYVKSSSLISLISAGTAAALLSLSLLSSRYKIVGSLVVTGTLTLFFAVRFWTSMRFMPSGLMLIISAIVLGVVSTHRQKCS